MLSRFERRRRRNDRDVLKLSSDDGKLASGLLLFVAIACLAIVSVATWHAMSGYRQRLDEIKSRTTNLARSVIQNAEDSIQMVDAVLASLVERLEHDDAATPDMARLRLVLAMHAQNLPRLRGLFVYDAAGRWLATSLPDAPTGLNNSDRDYFKYHRENPDRGPYIGQPVKSRSGGQWIMTVTRRFNHPDGTFAGVVLASMDAEYFARWYEGFDLAANDAISLFRTDGTLLARRPFDDTVIGRNYVSAPLFKEWLPKGTAGTIRAQSAIDGVMRLSGYRVSTRYPLVALAAVGEEQELAEWRTAARVRIIGAGILVGIVGIIGLRLTVQIRRRQKAEHALAQSGIRFRLLAENSSDMVTHIGLDGRHRYVSPASRRLLGWEPDDLIGRPAIEEIHPDDRPAVLAQIERLRTGEIEEVSITFRMHHREGRQVWIDAAIRVSRDAGQVPTGVVAVSRDVTERRHLEEKLAALASVDALTGVGNRRSFDETFATEWRRAAREQLPLSLLLVDVDHFKAYNDGYGHQAGDECLRAVATTLASAVRRPADGVTRYGGEEFAVVLPNTDATGAVDVAERMRAAVEGLGLPHHEPQPGSRVTVSIGVATAVPLPEGSSSRLIAAADSALYGAKRAGRNRVMVSPPILPPPAANPVRAPLEPAG